MASGSTPSDLPTKIRRGSIASIATTVDKDQLSSALDQIHTAASQSDSLTTFNDFAEPPSSAVAAESKNSAGDLVQQGFSGLYSRFREAVGAGSPTRSTHDEGTSHNPASSSKRSSIATEGRTPRSSVIQRVDRSASISTTSSQQFPLPEPSPTTISSPVTAASKALGASLLGGEQSNASSRHSFPRPAGSTAVEESVNSSARVKRDQSRSTARSQDASSPTLSRKSMPLDKVDLPALSPSESAAIFESRDSRLPPRSKREDTPSIDESIATATSPTKEDGPSLPNIQPHHVRAPSGNSTLLSPTEHGRRQPVVIDRLRQSRSPAGFSESRGSSSDGRSARNAHQRSQSQTTGISEATYKMNSQLDKMKKQILTKESWMKDETVKECFLCQTPFSAFRRKHHCRTCGCIFDNKCTTVIQGAKFGVSGSLRVCKRCLEVINRRNDSGSASDDSGDEQGFMPRIFGTNQPAKSPNPSSPAQGKASGISTPPVPSEMPADARSITTPLMAIPATRRLGNSNRGILEIEGPQLSRPGSSRSLRSMTSGRPPSAAGHKRHHSKHGLFGRLRPNAEQSAPFRKGIDEESAKRPKFPAFHDDNIIDPELADYMSDDSSGDEQMSLFATMSSNDIATGSFDKDRSNFGHYVTSNKRHRHRNEKSVSGISHFSRGLEDLPGPASVVSHRRPVRRRNLSNVSGNPHHLSTPRPRSAIFQEGPTVSSDLFPMDHSGRNSTQLARSNSTQYKKVAKDDLNTSSRKHVDRLLQQLLEDAEISNITAWQKALIPILLRATDDIDPDVAKGEDMDARHYVKLKRIPGGRPNDTSYVSGVVFTKNLALKSMPRRIKNPRILLLSFAVEYQRHHMSFTSLGPVFSAEKEYLRVVVQRIINLRPTLLLVEKGVSGVALKYLSEANIAIAYNVKHSVLEAVARCAETEIITSMDAMTVHSEFDVGICSSFEVRTFVNNDYPGKKKSYIFLDGCRADLGCTIALRGSNNRDLARIKYIVEFMVYVVYNLKLESSLLRDEAVEAPEIEQGSLSSSLQGLTESDASAKDTIGSIDQKSKTEGSSSVEEQPPTDQASNGGLDDAGDANSKPDFDEPDTVVAERPRLVSMHETHTGRSHDGHFAEDIPMPTFYSDMVAKYETKILSASPYVKFSQPYLLDKAREQERRLLYLKKLRDHDIVEEKENAEKLGPQPFQLIKPEMVDEIGQKAPRQSMEILHAAHDAEYDKALFHYQTQTKQWETYIQGNLDLFDPYSHQNIVVLYSVICTESKVPCVEPNLVAINFYDEQHVDTGMDPDCSIGQYIEDLVFTKDEHCGSTACGRRMLEHHRTYVHDQSRITVFVEEVTTNARRDMANDGITMWTYCKVCKKDSDKVPMSSITFKYSFGKYLELIYWGRGLRMKNEAECPHDHHRDHIRYFGLMNCQVRIHWDPIDLLEIIVPRPRITWKVANDLQLKNDIFERMGDRWHRFMGTVKSRLDSIRIDSSVLPDKAESCKADLETLKQKHAHEEPEMIARLQDIYVNSKYYEIVPFNSIIREMVVKAGEWDQAFAKFEADYLGDKDMRQLTMMQLKKMFTDNDSKESLASNGATGSSADSDALPSQTFSEVEDKTSQPTELTEPSVGGSPESAQRQDEEKQALEAANAALPPEDAMERVEPLDLANTPATPGVADRALSTQSVGSEMIPAPATPTSTVEASSETHLVLPGESVTDAAETNRQASGEQSNKVQRGPNSQNSEGPDVSEAVPAADEHQSPDMSSARRRSGLDVSPPLIRAISQPVRTLPRNQTSSGKSLAAKDVKVKSPEIPEPGKPTEGTLKADKRLSDRLGLSGLKNRGKAASSIPRLVKRKESKVSTLARHFEQLSREFEKERIRDRKKRAASMRQPRAMLPRTTTRAIVEVYDNVAEAFEEPNHSTEVVHDTEKTKAQDPGPDEAISTAASAPESILEGSAADPLSDPASAEEVPRSNEQDEVSLNKTSQSYSDDEGATSEPDQAVSEEFLGGIKEIAESLEPSTEIPLELPKHQKTSLMKYLTNFWAERSASAWPMLDYPVNPTDHIFTDSDIVVREDEPSSVIALALSNDDYQDKLAELLKDAQDTMHRDASTPKGRDSASGPADNSNGTVDETEIEKSLLRLTGTHLRYQFKEGQAMMACKIFFAEQFDALRRKCGVSERILESLSRCLKWDSRGGKTKSVFLKTLDDRFILKSLSPIETSAFLKFAPGYFNIMAEALFHELPSVIAKMFGFFQVFIKNPATGTDVRLDLLLTENLFYDRSPSRIFDLKGSMRNRKIESTGEQNEVLLDENMVEYIYESPLFAREHAKKLLRASVWNDTLFLARQDVMDYSLMIAVDEAKKELVVGIIDCIRTYTWDKKLESWIKDRGFAGGGRNRPTVTSPKEYKSRFREAMARYILQAPNCWHLFNNIQYPHFPGPHRARFEEPEPVRQK